MEFDRSADNRLFWFEHNRPRSDGRSSAESWVGSRLWLNAVTLPWVFARTPLLAFANVAHSATRI